MSVLFEVYFVFWLILIRTLRDRHSYYLPFTDAKTEHGEVT